MTSQQCSDPEHCPVPNPGDFDLRRLRIRRVEEGTTFHTAYDRRHWPKLFNPLDQGNSRFSPLKLDVSVVPTLYGAESKTVALLETIFHDVHTSGIRQISESLHLAKRGLVALTAPNSLPLVDLTDDNLLRIGLKRHQLVATGPIHYPCTREWAAALHARTIGGIEPVGLVWQSRVAELAEADSLLFKDLMSLASEVFVLFGDRLMTEPEHWLPGEHFDDLTSGDGRVLAEQIAEQLDAVIIPN